MIALAALLLCFMQSCEKDGPADNPENDFKDERVKTVTGADAFEGWQLFYTYDAQKRIIQEIEVLWGRDTTRIAEYTYSGDRASRKIIQNNSIKYKNYKLNAKGYIISDTASEGSIYTYEYNHKGFITKMYNNEAAPYVLNYYYNASNGLLDSTRATIGGVWYSTQSYTYDMNRINTLEDKNFGQSFYGSRHLRPFTHYEYKYTEGNVVKTQIIDYLFTYDEKGRIKSKSYESVGQKLTNHYTYY